MLPNNQMLTGFVVLKSTGPQEKQSDGVPASTLESKIKALRIDKQRFKSA
jgi:hypothetical protein